VQRHGSVFALVPAFPDLRRPSVDGALITDSTMLLPPVKTPSQFNLRSGRYRGLSTLVCVRIKVGVGPKLLVALNHEKAQGPGPRKDYAKTVYLTFQGSWMISIAAQQAACHQRTCHAHEIKHCQLNIVPRPCKRLDSISQANMMWWARHAARHVCCY